jgi:hypothetical protein
VSKYTHCDKCEAVIPPYALGAGSDGLDRKLELRLGNTAATSDLCVECYREVFALLRSWFPAKQALTVEPPKQLQPTSSV